VGRACLLGGKGALGGLELAELLGVMEAVNLESRDLRRRPLDELEGTVNQGNLIRVST
jgi:hypothetical protein